MFKTEKKLKSEMFHSSGAAAPPVGPADNHAGAMNSPEGMKIIP